MKNQNEPTPDSPGFDYWWNKRAADLAEAELVLLPRKQKREAVFNCGPPPAASPPPDKASK
jgi:hypothetical protein